MLKVADLVRRAGSVFGGVALSPVSATLPKILSRGKCDEMCNCRLTKLCTDNKLRCRYRRNSRAHYARLNCTRGKVEEKFCGRQKKSREFHATYICACVCRQNYKIYIKIANVVFEYGVVICVTLGLRVKVSTSLSQVIICIYYKSCERFSQNFMKHLTYWLTFSVRSFKVVIFTIKNFN